MNEHELKTWPKYFEAVASGEKTVELRSEADRHFEVGDRLLLREWDNTLRSEKAAQGLKAAIAGALQNRIRKDIKLALDRAYVQAEVDGAFGAFTGRTCSVIVTHVVRDPDGEWLQPNIVALSVSLAGVSP